MLDELYEPGLTIDKAADSILDRGLAPPGLRAFYPDPASPGGSRALEARLDVRAQGDTGGELKGRLRYIRAALNPRNAHLPECDPERLPRLLINRRCVNTIREFSDYRYPETRNDQASNANERPLKKDDHTPEALGRRFVGYFSAPANEGPRGHDGRHIERIAMPPGGRSPYSRQPISRAELYRAHGNRCQATAGRTRGGGRVKCCRQSKHEGAHYDYDRDAWWGTTPAGSVRIFPRSSP